jgi:glycosyltransferase involved in cell wall biosynthesis
VPTERARLCLVVGHLGRGGLEKQAFLLATGLAGRGFEVSVVSLSQGGAWVDALAAKGIPVVQLRRLGPFDLWRLARLVSTFRERRPDLVYAFNYPTTVYARLAGLVASVPVLVTGERAIYMNRLQAALERLLSRVTDCVICNAEAIRGDLVKRVGIPAGRVLTVRNGVEAGPPPAPKERRAARALLGVPEEGFLVGTVGHIEDVKNLSMLVEVAHEVRRKGLPARFCIVGGGSRTGALRSQIRARGLDDAFILTGERAAAAELLPAFDVFVLTSLSEGLPNTVMEAMAAGLACVCTDVGGCRELVLEGTSGFLVPPNDTTGMARRLLELAGDAGLRASLGAAGRARILREFPVDRLLTQTEGVLRDLLAARDASPRGRRLIGRPATAAE